MSTQAPRQMHLGAFLFNLGNHVAAWRHPDTPVAGLMELGFYRRLAQAAERGKFDFVFHSDGVGINDTYDVIVGHTVTIRPEPISLLSALAACTDRIGLAGTVSTTYNEPYAVARKFATLDHLSGGRAAMNVVTSSTAQEAQNFGAAGHMDHDARYRRAAEFVGVVRRLWDSWEDGAIVADKATGRFADPARVHHLHHQGEFLSVRGPLNVPRPPQGHPVVIQAGTSPAGQALAAAEADLVFTVNLSMADARDRTRRLKSLAVEAGRSPGSLKIMPGLMPVVGRTQAEAQEKYAALQALIPAEIGIPYLSDLVDYDLTRYDPDGPLPDLPAINGGQGRFKMIELLGREGLTLGQVAHRMLLARGHLTMIGTPESIADEMASWFAAEACDGFNILAPTHPDGLEAFVDTVVPVLQERGLFRTEYAGTMLRDHLGLERPANSFAPLR
jgi:FMN-dependent oxidoreductase (nitrilotriacetate monooxygenase family)